MATMIRYLVLCVAAAAHECLISDDQLQEYWPDVPNSLGLAVPHCAQENRCEACWAEWSSLRPIDSNGCGTVVNGCVAYATSLTYRPTLCLHGDVLVHETLHTDQQQPLTIHGPATLDGQGTVQILRVLNGGMLRLHDLVIRNGYSPQHGGGIYVESGGILHMERVDFIANRALEYGGGIFLAHPTSIHTLNLASIRQNHAQWGGGIFINDSDVRLVWTHGGHDDNHPSTIHGWWTNTLTGHALPLWDHGFDPMNYINVLYS